MKKILFFITICLSLFTLLPQKGMCSWEIFTEELPPFNFERDGKVYGISTDILLELLRMAGTPVARENIQLIPWPRAYNTVLTTPGTILFSAARTEEREPLFQWVGPIHKITIGLIAKKESNILIHSIEDLRKYKIGTIRKGAPEQLVIKAGINEDSLDRISDPVANVKKLQSGRIDMFAFNVPTTRYLMATNGIDPDQYEVVWVLKEAEIYYAFHNETDTKTIEKLNFLLDEMKQGAGEAGSFYDLTIARYLEFNK